MKGILRIISVVFLISALVAVLIPTQAAAADIVETKLLAVDGAEGDLFGHKVAVSEDTMVVGARVDDNENGENAGSAYVFVRDGDTWTQQAKLLASDGASNDLFGGKVDIDGDTIVISAFHDDDNGEDSGSAYVFTRSSGIWT